MLHPFPCRSTSYKEMMQSSMCIAAPFQKARLHYSINDVQACRLKTWQSNRQSPTNLEGLHSRACHVAKLPPQHVVLPRPKAFLSQGYLQLMHMAPPIPLPEDRPFAVVGMLIHIRLPRRLCTCDLTAAETNKADQDCKLQNVLINNTDSDSKFGKVIGSPNNVKFHSMQSQLVCYDSRRGQSRHARQ